MSNRQFGGRDKEYEYDSFTALSPDIVNRCVRPYWTSYWGMRETWLVTNYNKVRQSAKYAHIILDVNH